MQIINFASVGVPAKFKDGQIYIETKSLAKSGISNYWHYAQLMEKQVGEWSELETALTAYEKARDSIRKPKETENKFDAAGGVDGFRKQAQTAFKCAFKVIELENEIESLQKELKRQETQLGNLDKSRYEFKIEKERKSEKITSLNMKLTTTEKEVESLQNQLSVEKERFASLKADLEKEINESKKEAAEAKTNAESLQRELETIKKEKAGLAERLKEALTPKNSWLRRVMLSPDTALRAQLGVAIAAGILTTFALTKALTIPFLEPLGVFGIILEFATCFIIAIVVELTVVSSSVKGQSQHVAIIAAIQVCLIGYESGFWMHIENITAGNFPPLQSFVVSFCGTIVVPIAQYLQSKNVESNTELANTAEE